MLERTDLMKIKKPNYTNSILKVSNTFLNHYGINTPYNVISSLKQNLTSDINHIIYILLDGLGSNIVKHHLSDNDYLKKYMVEEITSVFPPTTVAATDAVLSGVPPISNGYIGWVQYFLKEDVNAIVFQNKDFYDLNRKLTVNLRETYLPFTPITKQIEQKNSNIKTEIFFPSFIEGGSKSFAEEIDKALLTAHNTDNSFSYLYWIEPDLTQHKTGIYSDETRKVVKSLNKDFTELCKNITDDTLVVVIADHGLTDVEEIPLFQYTDITSLLLRQPSIEPRATNFFVKEGKETLFKKRFNQHFSEYYTLYTKKDFLLSGLLGKGQQHPMIDSFLGQFFAIAKTNKMFTLNPNSTYKAHHAGLSEDEMMVPIIIYKK
jgi:hypothetical protein